MEPQDENDIDEVLKILLEGVEPAYYDYTGLLENEPVYDFFSKQEEPEVFETQTTQTNIPHITNVPLIEDTMVFITENQTRPEKRKKESPSLSIKDSIESIISGFKVSDIYKREGSNKSYLRETGRKLREQIYDYIRNYKINEQDFKSALNLMNVKSLDFLSRLFALNPRTEKRQEKSSLMLEHLQNKNLFVEETVPYSPLSDLVSSSTKRRISRSSPQDSTGGSLQIREGQVFSQVFSKLEPYLKDPSRIFNQLKPSSFDKNVWTYEMSTYGGKLKNEVQNVFSKLKLSRDEIINILDKFENKYILKMFKVLEPDFYLYPMYSINLEEKAILIDKLADRIQKLSNQ
jgi:hypothetical protein